MTRRSLYIPSTPRHLLIAVALAAGEEGGRARHLMIVSHHSTASVGKYVDLLRAWPGCPFETVEVLDGDYRARLSAVPAWRRPLARNAVKARLRRANRRLLDARIREWRPDRVYVGADDFFETEYALHLSQRLDPGAGGVYMEDGAVAYDDSFKPRALARRLKAPLKKLTFGTWFESVPVTGTHSRIGEAWVAFPDLVIPALRRKRLRHLTPEMLGSPTVLEFARRVLDAFGVDVERLGRCRAIVLLARSSWARHLPGYAETMGGLCRRLVERGIPVAVKYHPREFEHGFLPLRSSDLLYVVPQNVLLEHFLLGLAADRALTVIAQSTALLTARWLKPRARVISLVYPASGRAGIDRFLHEHCRALEIHMERDPAAVVDRHFGAGAAGS